MDIVASIVADSSKDNILAIAQQFIRGELKLPSYIHLLEDNDPSISFRFIWLLEHIALQKPDLVYKHLNYIYSLRNQLHYPGYKRGLAKLISVCGFPERLEGELVELLFDYLNDSNSDIAAKVFAMQALSNICLKYPELSNELIASIESQYEMGTAAFKLRANRLLPKLEKLA